MVLVDRKKDMIMSDGYKVYPREIDEVFYKHPSVQEACAIGVHHSTKGEAVIVFVALKKEKTTSEQELIDYCKEKLAPYKVPIRIEFRKELPKNTMGKILRRLLRTGIFSGVRKHGFPSSKN
ncbi:hypothetical protein GMMP15_810006 [Candidatus Magnetomoraceae bacterium gMMP-15]